ncbi:pre-mRNA splicing factor [Carpediemonas membranifera]|uniref:Pre-mRNA splicing factor n=1 Tax=Carpediemonas membranifera TaxID=201153 RepID=A0A8J6B561_9EUKA|nr:pre-mRNA splicing factor [Carpediemonas membranifera]|eukprot:KAG9390267.1 pre-mRNA splicing factor [Carpediemonas membranifera]
MPQKSGFHNARRKQESRLNDAHLHKKDGDYATAKELYTQAQASNPREVAAWVEGAKLSEELGDDEAAVKQLIRGIRYIPRSEQLYLPAIRLLMKHNRFDMARSLVGNLSDVPVDQCWRILIEATMIEHLDGRPDVVWRVYEHVLEVMRKFGPAYFEIVKVEMRFGNVQRALAICERGLRLCPRYSPLWLETVRLYELTYLSKLSNPEKYDVAIEDHRQRTNNFHIDTVLRHVTKAYQHLPEDAMWRMTLETGRALAHAGLPVMARSHFVRVLPICPPSQRWKVWLAGSRLEAALGLTRACSALQDLAEGESQGRAACSIILDRARSAALAGDVEHAADLLDQGCIDYAASWTVWVEAIDIYRMMGDIETALEVSSKAVAISPSTGRIWARIISLTQAHGQEAQQDVLEKALAACPKSGEVWTEAARIALNPLNTNFSVSASRRMLNLAVDLTGQFGDPLIELLRLQLATYGPGADISDIKRLAVLADPSYGPLWSYCRFTPHDGPIEVLEHARAMILAELELHRPVYNAAMARRQEYVAAIKRGQDGSRVESVQSRLSRSGVDLAQITSNCGKFPFSMGLQRLSFLENNLCRRDVHIDQHDRYRVIYAGLV